jgi:alpha-mannosidase
MSCHGCSSDASRPPYPLLNYTPGAKWVKSLTKSRLGNFSGGHFADVNLSSILFTHRIDNPEHVKLQVWSAPGLTKPTFEDAMKQKFKPAKKGDSFGPSCTLIESLPLVRSSTRISFRGESNDINHLRALHLLEIDKSLVEGFCEHPKLLAAVRACPVLVRFACSPTSELSLLAVEFDPGCEAMIFSTDGSPLQGQQECSYIDLIVQAFYRNNRRVRRRSQSRIHYSRRRLQTRFSRIRHRIEL